MYKNFVGIFVIIIISSCSNSYDFNKDEDNAGVKSSLLNTRQILSYNKVKDSVIIENTIDDNKNADFRYIIYFPYDSNDISADEEEIISRNATYLAGYPKINIRIEGHTDERGSREYNLALGEKRSKRVSEYLQKYGIDSKRIEIISYGEEKPAVIGSSPSAWQKNRRVEILY